MTRAFVLFFLFCLSCFSASEARDRIRLEAEEAREIYHGNVEAEHGGYSGSGYVNLHNEEGSYLAWSLHLPEQSTCTLNILFANGSEATRYLTLELNGEVLAPRVPFVSQGDWSHWQQVVLPMEKLGRQNDLKIISVGEHGGPNLDFIEFSGLEIPDSCPPSAVDDYYLLDHPRPFACHPLENDADLNGDSLELLFVKSPMFGTIQIEEPGFWYHPDADFVGHDSCYYVVSDGLLMDTAWIHFEVRNTDWSVAVVEHILAQGPGESFADWHYKAALFLEGLYRVYHRTGNLTYLEFISDWANSQIDEKGSYTKNIDRLDHMLPGIVFLRLYEESGEERYRQAALKICQEFEAYPRTSDQGLWHMKKTEGQLWLDGLYMSMPLLARSAHLLEVGGNPYEEVVQQFRTYFNHLYDQNTGLLFHAYDEDGSSAWAGESHHHSPEFWGRSIGWFCMALVEVMELMPSEEEGREDLEGMLESILLGLIRYQDMDSGLWYQVVNRGMDDGNWLETSCTMMYTYCLKRFSDRAYGEHDFSEFSKDGYLGVLSKTKLSARGEITLMDICEGTGVGDYTHYINRQRINNDLHGLGAFLIMNELLAYNNMAVQGEGHTGISRALSGSGIRVFPNPASLWLQVEVPGDIQKHSRSFVYALVDASGREVSSGELKGDIKRIGLQKLNPGIYFLRMRSDSIIMNATFIKE